jgi:hypothetical protein
VRRGTHREHCPRRGPEFKANDSEATALPRPERARGQEHGWKAGAARRRVRLRPATPTRYGENWIVRTSMSSGGTAHSLVARLYSDAIGMHGIDFLPCHALADRRCSVRALKDMSGAPTSRSDVSPEWNRGGPTSRETHGPGVLVVPKSDCCNGMTRTDGKVCRWLADHRPGDPVRGRAGEGEQVI